MSKRDLSPDSLEAQADALLAAADSMDIPDEIPMPGKSSRSGKAAKAARPEADHIMTDEEAKRPVSSVWTISRSLPSPPPAG